MPKKIYFVVHSFSAESTGGVNRVVSVTANELAKDPNYDVNIVSLGKLDGIAYPVADVVNLHSLGMKKHSTSQYRSILKVLWLFFSYFKLMKFYKKHKDKSAWNITSPVLIILFYFFRKYKNIFIYCEHTSPLGKRNGWLKNKLRSLFLNKGDKTISLNKKDDDYYKSIKVDSQVIYNGCEKTNIYPYHKSKVIIFVGRFSKEKDPIEALDIFYQSNIWKKGYTMKLFGSGELLEDINNFCQRVNIEEYVKIISSEKDPVKIYSGASALIMTSHYEGLPMVLIEAISSSIPCLSYDCPQGPSEIIINDINGYLIENRNKKYFIDKLSSLSHETIPCNSILNSAKKFDILNIIDEWKKIV